MKSKLILIVGLLFLVLFIFNTNCSARPLLNGWILSTKDGTYNSTIPSTVIDDLIRSRVLPQDFYYRDNFLRAYQYQTQNATYTLNFYLETSEQNSKYKELIFQGLDTHCEVFLNDKKILESRNMFRRYQISVQLLRSNNLTVKFYSAPNHDIVQQKLFESQYGFNLPQNYSFSRKAAYHYGWDWGPRIASSGIWKEIYLNCYNDSKITNLELKQLSEITTSTNFVSTQININISKLDQNSNYSLQIEVVSQKNSSKVYNNTISISNKNSYQDSLKWNITENVKSYIWWVWELGQQPLFNLSARLINQQTKQQLTQIVQGIGFRTVKLIQVETQGGKQFTINLNGLDVYARGGNYIPPEMSLSKTTSQTYKTVIKNARQQNFNMIRVWGGGHFEKDDFYLECSKNGIMIWHDLMYACALYPYSDSIANDIEQQMRDNLLRLRQHPSLALWNGNNEVWIGWLEWGWKNNKTEEQKAQVQAMYKGTFQNSLPKVINQITPQIPYWQTSPSVSSGSLQTIKSGDIHFWRVWGGGKPIQQYNQYIGRFNSQFGMQSMPDISTIQNFTLPQDRKLGNIILSLHQRHPLGDKYLPQYIKNNTHYSQNLTRFSYLSQIMQSYALQLATISLRGNKPYNMGSLYWQLNDVWPVSSWSTIDYLQNRKASHYKIKQIYQPFMIGCYNPTPDTIGNYIVYANNDLNQTFYCQTQIDFTLFNGTVINTTFITQVIPPMQKVQITKVVSQNQQMPTQMQRQSLSDAYSNSFLKISSSCGDQKRNYNFFFTKMKNRAISDPELKYEYSKANNSVKVSAKNIATYIWIYSIVKDKHFSFKNIEDNYFTLLPGETRIINLGTHEIQSEAGVSVTCYENQVLKEEQEKEQSQYLQNLQKQLKVE